MEELDPLELARAREAAELEYGRLGIPARFWDTVLLPKSEKHPTGLRFRSCFFPQNKKGFTPAAQRSALSQVIAEPRGQLICIGSPVDGDAALAAACAVLCQAHDDGHRTALVNAEQTRSRLPDRLKMYVIHNLMFNCTDDRAEATRDLLVRYRRPARIVVVAGCNKKKDPYDWFTSRLCLYPDFVCWLRD